MPIDVTFAVTIRLTDDAHEQLGTLQRVRAVLTDAVVDACIDGPLEQFTPPDDGTDDGLAVRVGAGTIDAFELVNVARMRASS